ncbi:hypothetical protein NQF87_08655 [Bombella sp. TMW 2.2559]|uniref:Uncharacterized protein n=1 Tax=Bombella dulcis TaxID=2967339 RepID=A0ABT3WD95_9PROT|nr:hypothetical protein [Bombella dulcis]MCX5617031.1 hypothetical protein [Bombella dulcis]
MANTVTVLCRLPSGVILELHDLDGLKSRTASEAPVMQAAAALRSVTLKGAKHDPSYHEAEGRLLGRVGRTEVDADFWKAWLDQNQRNQLVTQYLVFAEANAAKADAAAAELSKEKTGLEGEDRNALPNNVKKLEK